jgi:hypothetical protein
MRKEVRFPLGSHPVLPRTARLVLLMALALAATEVPDRLRTVRSSLEIIRLWPDRVAQTRQVVGPELYDALTTVDRTLPRNATVLLVTAGTDVRHWEYVAFHRALYFLAPRPVWWVAPVDRDGTWESRWWTPTVLSAEALAKHAAMVGATHVLSFGVAPAAVPGQWMRDLPARGGLSMLPAARVAARAVPDATEIDGTWPLRLFAAISVLVLAGHLMIECIASPDLRGLGIHRLALDWLLGAGAISLGMFWLGSLGVPLPAQVGILTGLVLVGALVLHPWRSIRIPWGGMPNLLAERWLIGGLLAWVCAEIGFVVLLAVGQPLRVWDSWVTWGMRARLIYLQGGIDPVLYSDLSRLVTRLSYPLLVPLIEAWTYVWLGAPDDRFAGVQAVMFFMALIGLVFTAIRASASLLQASPDYALAVVVGLVSITHLDGLAGMVFADVPLAAYTTATALFLRRWLVHGSSFRDLIMAAALAGLMLWTKSEGFLLLATLTVASLLATRGGRRAWVAYLAMGSAAAVVVGPWYARIAALGIPEPAYQPFTWTAFVANIGRLPRIVALFAARAVQLDWHFLWIATVLVGFYLILTRRPMCPLFLVTAAVYLGAIMLVFVFSDYVPLEAHIVSSADRLLAHVAPLAALWLVELPFAPHAVMSSEVKQWQETSP